MITTKWPALIVVGEEISPQLALEINIRTTRWPLSTNEHEYNAELMSYVLGRTMKKSEYGFCDWKEGEEVNKILRVIDTEYIHNNWLASCYILGPAGWCNPDGTIFSNNYNIGKWPSSEAVFEDLQKIAKEWPMLKMKVQTLSDEYCEDNLIVTDQWNIENGIVQEVIPESRLDEKFPKLEVKWNLDRSEIYYDVGTVKVGIDAIKRKFGK